MRHTSDMIPAARFVRLLEVRFERGRREQRFARQKPTQDLHPLRSEQRLRHVRVLATTLAVYALSTLTMAASFVVM
ncbi:hypothetical protein SNE35_31160 [Paucibacter sp. R3-3]|uniref:Uncharacterized protein n=1 Tax=Roseateles agri TaxID=3098619 RepID=A0ABU5DRP8_9BURK|nr:hypothetical protein [Paucibacter sp. R3-3]MDY0748999.1 hypothetical protein [Paucibacter sp. R3-3]